MRCRTLRLRAPAQAWVGAFSHLGAVREVREVQVVRLQALEMAAAAVPMAAEVPSC